MTVGLDITKLEIDARAGDLARAFQRSFAGVLIMQEFLLATPDPDLIALGYTAGEVTTLKTAYADLAQLRDIYEGSAPLPVAKDFTAFVSKLWGVGAF